MFARDTNNELSFFIRTKNWIKKNPLLTCGMVSALMIGGIFTSGVILLPFLASLALSIGAFALPIVCVVGFVTIVSAFRNSGEYVTLGELGLALGAGIGGICLVSTVPVLGLAVTCAAAMVIGGGIISAIASTLHYLFKSCFEKLYFREIETHLANQEEQKPLVASSNQTYTNSHMPQLLATATHDNTPLFNQALSSAPVETIPTNTILSTAPMLSSSSPQEEKLSLKF